MKSEKVIECFKKSRGFELLPSDCQEKIIRFFSEDTLSMADVSDVRSLLKSGHNFIIFETLEKLAEYSKNALIKGLIACKKYNWPSLDAFTQWGDQIADIMGEGTEYVLISYVFGSEKGDPEELYIASY